MLSREEEKREYLVSDRDLVDFTLRYLKPYRALVLASLAFIIVSSLLNLIPELVIRKIIDQDIVTGDAIGLRQSVLLMVTIYILSWIFSFGFTYSTSKLGQTTILDLRMDMYEHMLHQSQSYFDKNQSGKINSKLTNDLETLSGFLGSGLVDIMATVVQIVGIVVIMLALNVTLALISFSIIPLLVLLTFFIRGPVRHASRRTRKTIAKVTDNLSENISGAKTTKTFARETSNKREFSKINRENYEASMTATKLFAIIFPMVGVISALGTALILGYAGYQTAVVGNNIYSVGLVATFMAYLTRFFRPIFRISMFYSTFQSALASLERVYTFLDEEISITDQEDAQHLQLNGGKIEFDHVRFAYSDEIVVFEDLDVTVQPGSVTALVGETGAGKSTFIKMIPRFYDVNSGSIRIDDQDISSLSLSSLRAQIGVVPQTTHLFNTSILENIRYGTPDATEAQVQEVSQLVGLHDYINSLPDGYRTVVREEANRLSQGQKQLVSFARALLKDPPILILDEATSSLDVISEIRVQEALEKVIEGRTVIAIAHRLSTIRNADRILVIENGVIVQDGTHKELVKISGKYQDLYLKQFHDSLTINSSAEKK
jgi:ABC-type multidrug transport system fused ATPase/permease subunit